MLKLAEEAETVQAKRSKRLLLLNRKCKKGQLKGHAGQDGANMEGLLSVAPAVFSTLIDSA